MGGSQMKKVLLIADRPGWAYDILAQYLVESLNDWQCEIAYIVNIRRKPREFDVGDFDVVFFFLWYDAMRYGPDFKGFSFDKTCVGVHSHASWLKRGISLQQAKEICESFAACGVISNLLESELGIANCFLTPNGVNPNRFPLSQMPSTDLLKFMWVGNPSVSHHGDNKGFESIIKPVFEELEGVELLTATPENPISHDEMGQFYSDGHVLICMSMHEGGPLPVIEAMHCGRPVISTKVGIVPEIVEHGVNSWIVDRSRSALTEAITNLVENHSDIEKMGKKAHDAVVNRSISDMANNYRTMFESVIIEKGV